MWGLEIGTGRVRRGQLKSIYKLRYQVILTSLALPQVENITGLVYIIKRAAGIYRKSSPVENLFLYAEGEIVF